MATKIDKLLLYAKTWINLRNVMLREGSQAKISLTVWFHLYKFQNRQTNCPVRHRKTIVGYQRERRAEKRYKRVTGVKYIAMEGD